MEKPEYPYSPDKFDKAYYGERARGGFGVEIHWDNPIQQMELEKKFNFIKESGEYTSILFVGCALGNEVRYFRERYKQASGVEISEYAVANCDESVKNFIKLYNGWELKDYPDKSIDVVAAFDVLTLIPDDMLKKLVKEMCRVAKSSIVMRTIVDMDGKRKGEWIGNDGVTFRYLRFHEWVELLKDENFLVKRCPADQKDEVTFLFERFL